VGLRVDAAGEFRVSQKGNQMAETKLRYTDGTEQHNSPRNTGKRIHVDSKGRPTDLNASEIDDSKKREQ
jgi:hypothetical protein